MTTVIRTLATPAQIAAYFNGRTSKKPTKFPPRTVEPLVHQLSDGWRLQLPVLTEASNANGNRHASSARAVKHIDTVIAACQAQLRGIDRSAITAITLTRISPGRLDAHDNLRQAFKHVLDGVCAWIVRGDDFDAADRKKIGRFDDQLLGTGKIQCEYDQTTHESRNLQGIQIRFVLGPRPAEATGK